MRQFFENGEYFSGLLYGLAAFSVVCGLGFFLYSLNEQDYQNYQKALTTVTTCRMAAKEHADFVCGKIPDIKDFSR